MLGAVPSDLPLGAESNALSRHVNGLAHIDIHDFTHALIASRQQEEVLDHVSQLVQFALRGGKGSLRRLIRGRHGRELHIGAQCGKRRTQLMPSVLNEPLLLLLGSGQRVLQDAGRRHHLGDLPRGALAGREILGRLPARERLHRLGDLLQGLGRTPHRRHTKPDTRGHRGHAHDSKCGAQSHDDGIGLLKGSHRPTGDTVNDVDGEHAHGDAARCDACGELPCARSGLGDAHILRTGRQAECLGVDTEDLAISQDSIDEHRGLPGDGRTKDRSTALLAVQEDASLQSRVQRCIHAGEEHIAREEPHDHGDTHDRQRHTEGHDECDGRAE